ncbi:MAG: acetyl-CoA carboxylase biotin carboxyl carrier protein subunit [Bacteroidetes bacterium]|nr:acetyl-CoA carboxylase biotin carboxyl carrier protein subunit [Bacteroidota bacterium]
MEEKEEFTTFLIDDSRYQTRITKKFANRTAFEKPDPKQLRAFIPGVIQNILVQPGQTVRRGDSLLILEAMKMRNDVTAQVDGKIKSIHVNNNERVVKKHLLIEFE